MNREFELEIGNDEVHVDLSPATEIVLPRFMSRMHRADEVALATLPQYERKDRIVAVGYDDKNASIVSLTAVGNVCELNIAHGELPQVACVPFNCGKFVAFMTDPPTFWPAKELIQKSRRLLTTLP